MLFSYHLWITSEVRRFQSCRVPFQLIFCSDGLLPTWKDSKYLPNTMKLLRVRESRPRAHQQTDREHESRSSRLLRQWAAATCNHSQPRWNRQPTLRRAHQKPGSLCKPMCQDQGLELIQKKRALILRAVSKSQGKILALQHTQRIGARRGQEEPWSTSPFSQGELGTRNIEYILGLICQLTHSKSKLDTALISEDRVYQSHAINSHANVKCLAHIFSGISDDIPEWRPQRQP